MKILALFGPTAVGKTGVAIAVAERLRERGEDPVAVNCDSIQVYSGLEVLSGAADAEQQEQLEHRLLSFVDPTEEFSAGRYAELAHAEVDSLLAEGRRPIVVGGTGLYLRAALADLDLRPPVPEEVRAEVEGDLTQRGSAALHAELDPEYAAGVDPNDRKRIARLTELARAGIEPARSSDRLWTAELRHPTVLVGLSMARGQLGERIDARVDEMVASAAGDEARRAAASGATIAPSGLQISLSRSSQSSAFQASIDSRKIASRSRGSIMPPPPGRAAPGSSLPHRRRPARSGRPRPRPPSDASR